MSGFLLRDARLVPLEPGLAAGEPVDVLVADGRVVEVGHGLQAPPGSRSTTPRGAG